MTSVRICTWKHDAPFAYSMTYDEGTVDTFANALPIHEVFGFPGHVDVLAGQLGRPRNAWLSSMNGYQHMGPEELRVLLTKGWGVGNHSWSHMVYPCQPGLDLWREVVWSKYRLEDVLEHPVRIFTLPNDAYNYEAVLPLVKQHYLALVCVDGGVNRGDFDLFAVGNNLVAAEGPKPRPGWPEELKTANLALDCLVGGWLLDTTHLCLPNAPQPHKCVTPETLEARFAKLHEISEGRLWPAKPDDVIDYERMRRSLHIENVRIEQGHIVFDVAGEWPLGTMNPTLTLRVSGVEAQEPPGITQTFHKHEGGYAGHQGVETVERNGADWLVTLALAPHRTVRVG